MSLRLLKVALKIGGRPLVTEVSVDIHQGEVVGLLGPNGAGKTTTFNLLIGLLTPDVGKVLLDDKPVSGLSMPNRARLGIGYLPQESSIFRQLTVKQNLELALSQEQLDVFTFRAKRDQLIIFLM